MSLTGIPLLSSIVFLFSTRKRQFVINLLAMLLICLHLQRLQAQAEHEQQSMRKPNIIMIVGDDVNKAYHGCYGGRTPTPNLDRLAQNGIRFDRALAVTPMCNPSRFTFLTGQFPGRNSEVQSTASPNEPYYVDQNTRLQNGATTIATMLNEAGYFTGYVGKWHSNFEMVPAGLESIRLPKDGSLGDPDFEKLLRQHQDNACALIRRSAGFDYASNILIGNYPNGKPDALSYHNVEWHTEGMLGFLEQARQRQDQPFFLHLANSVPHGPSAAESIGRNVNHTLEGTLDLSDTPHPPREALAGRAQGAGMETEGPVWGINAGVMMLDDQVGILLDRLEAMGALDNTLILYFGDHGIYGKFSSYHPGLETPLIASWPAEISGGQTFGEPVSLADMVPTALEAAGATAPIEHQLDGASLLPLMTRQVAPSRKTVYAECGYTRSVVKGDFQYIALRYPDAILQSIREGRYPMAPDHFGKTGAQGWAGNLNIRFKPHYFEPDQLYNIADDPFCRINLASYPDYAAVLKELKADLRTYLARFPQPFPLDATAPVFDTAEWQDLVAKRYFFVATIPYHPQGEDAEKIYNLNLPSK